MTFKVDVMNLYWSASGLPLGSGEISRFDFEARAKSAAKAGLTGMGLWHTDLEHCTVHRTLKEMRSILDDNGIKHLELEFLTDWFVDGARRAESNNRKRRLLEASAALGAHHIKVGDFYSTATALPRLIDEFAELCKEAEDFGATIGFEFMGSGVLPSLARSMEMILGAGAKNGGVIIDSAHTTALGVTNDEISRIPGDHLVCVELNDNVLTTDPTYDGFERRFCGEGDFDLKGFIAAVQQTGYTGPWAVEVFSSAITGWSLDRLNETAYQTTMAQFD